MFTWLVWKNKILTWDNLLKRGYLGPGHYTLCINDFESCFHIFLFCTISKDVWKYTTQTLRIMNKQEQNIEQCITKWDVGDIKYKDLLFYIFQEIWNAINHYIFKGVPIKTNRICHHIISWLSTPPKFEGSSKYLSYHNIPPKIFFLASLFDGETQLGSHGYGVWLKINERKRYKLHWNDNPSTNTNAIILALWDLWGLLCFAKNMEVNSLHVYGYSRTLIEGINGHTTFDSPILSRWIDHIKQIMGTLPGIFVQHIYHE